MRFSHGSRDLWKKRKAEREYQGENREKRGSSAQKERRMWKTFFNFPIFRGKWERFSTGRGEVKAEHKKHGSAWKAASAMQQWGEETKQLQICVNERKNCNLFGNLQILPLRCGKLCGKCSKLFT